MESMCRVSLVDLALELLVVSEIVKRCKVTNLDTLWSYKDAAVGWTCEVLLTLDGAIVLTRRLVQLYANPRSQARDLRNLANKFDGTSSRVRLGQQTTS